MDRTLRAWVEEVSSQVPPVSVLSVAAFAACRAVKFGTKVSSPAALPVRSTTGWQGLSVSLFTAGIVDVAPWTPGAVDEVERVCG